MVAVADLHILEESSIVLGGGLRSRSAFLVVICYCFHT